MENTVDDIKAKEFERIIDKLSKDLKKSYGDIAILAVWHMGEGRICNAINNNGIDNMLLAQAVDYALEKIVKKAAKVELANALLGNGF